jgi:mannitol/fructose-specific phosphotransferase system IIA component (Ntr-type)
MTNPFEHFGFPAVDLSPSAHSSKESAVRFLIDQLAESGRLDAQHVDRVCSQIFQRESAGSTSIGKGIAIPHCKSEWVTRVAGIVGLAMEPIPWDGSLDQLPVRLICLLVTPASQPGTLLRELEALSRRMHGG